MNITSEAKVCTISEVMTISELINRLTNKEDVFINVLTRDDNHDIIKTTSKVKRVKCNGPESVIQLHINDTSINLMPSTIVLMSDTDIDMQVRYLTPDVQLLDDYEQGNGSTIQGIDLVYTMMDTYTIECEDTDSYIHINNSIYLK